MALMTKQVTVGGYKNNEGEVQDFLYTFKKFPATKGLDVYIRFGKIMAGELEMSADFVKEVICNSASIGSTGKMTPEKFDDHFSGQLTHMMNVYNEVLAFNFDVNFTEDDSEETN